MLKPRELKSAMEQHFHSKILPGNKAAQTLILVVLIVVMVAFSVFAQDGARSYHSVLPDNATAEDAPAPDDVIEAVGTVNFSTVPIYSAANKSSKILRYAIPGEKVNIIASNDAWYCIRLYTGTVGFVEHRNLKTVKVFYDERTTTNYMDKRLNVELADMVDHFNKTLGDSVYVRKYQVVPRLTLISTAKRGDSIMLTMEYCAVDMGGNIIPSRQDNMLQEEVKSFVELLFMKMLSAMAEDYTIVIRKPNFSLQGQVLSTREIYAELMLEHERVELENINNRKNPQSEQRLLTLIDSDIAMDKLFKDFPH